MKAKLTHRRRFAIVIAIGLGCVLVILSMAMPVAAWSPPTVDGVVDDVYYTDSQAIYFANATWPDYINALYVLDDATSDPDYIYFAYVVSPDFVDNTYGANTIGWPGGGGSGNHSFDHLVGSDMQRFEITNGCGAVVLDFQIDLLAPGQSTSSGYGTSGVSGSGQHRDGDITVGSASSLTLDTSLDYNLNDTGYCSGGSCSSGSTNLLVDSPSTDADYTPNAEYPLWQYEIIYEVRVDRSVFGTCGLGFIDPIEIHASPSKVGQDTIPVEKLASIGDYVWHDLFHSETHEVDGIQDAGEPGLEGVLVELYKDGGKVGDYTTNASGYYEFTGLSAGTYTVKIADSNFASGGVLEGWYTSPPDRGGDDTDSDGDETTHEVTVTLSSGETDNTIDFGFFRACIDLQKTGPTSVGLDGVITYHFRVENCGDVVLHGGAHVYDPLIEPSGDHEIWSAVVWPGEVYEFDRAYTSDENDCGELVNTANALGHPKHAYGYVTDVTDQDSWTVQVDCGSCLPTIDFETDAAGNSLAAGTIVAEQWAAWGVHVTVSPSSPGTGPAMIFDSGNPTGGDDDLGTPNEDFCADGSGLLASSPSCTAGPGPGIGTGGESGQPGANSISQGKILIISEDGSTSNPDDSKHGGTIIFTFDQPTPVDDVYVLDIEETGSKVKAFNAVSGGTLLAEVNMQTYDDNSFQVVPVNAVGVRRLEIIFGGSGGVPAVVFCRDTGSIGDYVWHDVNVNGLQDDGADAGIANVTVNLYSVTDTYTDTTQTDSSGYYIFNGLEPGDYYVEFVQPAGYDFSPQDQGTDDNLDSDADPITRKTTTITLGSGETDLTWDAGLHLCEIGDRVWHDKNGDGFQTAPAFPFDDDEGFNGVEVYLYPGTVISPTCGVTTGWLTRTTTISGTSQTPNGFPDGIYLFDMDEPGLGPGDYWVCVDESTLLDAGQDMHWARTTGDNPQKVTYTGSDDFSIDFGYEKVADPTAVTLSSFAAKPSTGGSVNPLWLGLAGLTVLAAGSLFWAKRRVG